MLTGFFPGPHGRDAQGAPGIANVTPADGAHVSGDVTVTGSGLSGGVVKAEVAVTLTAGLELVANGNFEQGETGWTRWHEDGSWGNGETYNFNAAPDTGHGAKCLHLSASTGSFGAYQQVQVKPGHTYKVDSYWRGKRVGDAQWYEILLIDGPFSVQQADCDSCGVHNNFMYAYDASTYPLSITVGAYFGWIWAHQQNAPPNNQVDWNNRAGLRTASGTTMTVVLKCGACCGTTGPDAWFDDVSLIEVGTEQLLATILDPGDPFEAVWHSGLFSDGNYNLRTTVYDGDSNQASIIRQLLKTNPTTAKADFNKDGSVDQSDFGHFQVCLTGISVVISNLNCQDADLMKDNDVDQDDLSLFMQCFTGSHLSVPAGCDSNYP